MCRARCWGVEEKLVEMTFQLYFKRLIKREK